MSLLNIKQDIVTNDGEKGTIKNYEVASSVCDAIRYSRSKKPKNKGEYFLRYGIKIEGRKEIRYYWQDEIIILKGSK